MRPTLREALTYLWTDSSLKAARELKLDSPIHLKEMLGRVGKVTVKFDTFTEELIAICKGQCTGFGFAVFDRDKKKRKGGSGLAVRPLGSTWGIDFTSDTRLNVHSISKTITAAVIVRALHVTNRRLDEPIKGFLPKKWVDDLKSLKQPDSHFDVLDITFEQLLVHNSGLLNFDPHGVDNRSLMAVKKSLRRAQKGTRQPSGKRTYQNVNYSLCRMLLPYIDNDKNSGLTKKDLDKMDEATFDSKTTRFFIDYVHKYFFAPCGLPGDIVPGPTGPPPFTRYYDFKKKDWTVWEQEPQQETRWEHVGASSWFMSAFEYGRFISGLRFKKIFGKPGERWSPWLTMCDFDLRTTPGEELKDPSDTYRLGMMERKIDNHLPRAVVALCKGGGGENVTTGWLAFGDLTAVLLINSKGGTLLPPDGALPPDEDSYDLIGVPALEVAAIAAISIPDRLRK
jgi:hypothetical protein